MYLNKPPISKWEDMSCVVVPSSPVLTLQNLKEPTVSKEELDRRTSFLSADGQRPTRLEMEAILGESDLLEINFIDRLQIVSKAVCRISIKVENGTEFATAFLVGPGLLLTNNHVFPDKKTAALALAEFDYRYNVAGELCSSTFFKLVPETFFLTNAELDYSLCAVSKIALDQVTTIESIGHLKLIPESGKVRKGDFVTIVQHPEGQPMQIALRENEVFECEDKSSVIWYHADTAPGSSGSPVFNDSLQVAALHQSGRIKRDANGRVMLKNGGITETTEGLTEQDVIWEANVGTRISSICRDIMQQAKLMPPEQIDCLSDMFHSIDLLATATDLSKQATGKIIDLTQKNDEGSTLQSEPVSVSVTEPSPNISLTDDSKKFRIPLNLEITIELSQKLPTTNMNLNLHSSQRERLELESGKMQIPIIYDGLKERLGFDSNFLELEHGKTIELLPLTESGKKIVAPLIGGNEHVLKYKNFSIVMHGERRLLLYAASNVDYRHGSRPINPATGKGYSRQTYTGIPNYVEEQWVIDERMSREYQLPDIFYDDDNKAFDKGHVVCREDVCWGSTFQEAQMSSGDTYHVTNCTPQIKEFNRSVYGKNNWGSLEKQIGKVTKTQRVIVFAGPVLNPTDRWFQGIDQKGSLKIQIPTRFWKIIVAKGPMGPEAYGFILEQNVISITEREVDFEPQWKAYRKSIQAIEVMMRGWVDLSGLIEIDHQKNRVEEPMVDQGR